MTAEVDDLVSRLKQKDLDRFVTLLEMHLSFLLDLSGSSLEDFLRSSHTEYASPERSRGFGNFGLRKSFKELRNVDDSSVFGVPLSIRAIGRIRPLINFLSLEESLGKEGLFRKSGHVGRQRSLRDKVNCGDAGVDGDLKAGVFTAHDCANVLKQFLGEMPDPLLSEKHYLAHCQISEMKSDEKKIQALQLLFRLLPNEHNQLLRSLLALLHSVARCSSNLMTAEALGTIFAPHLLVPKKVAPSDLHKKNLTLTRVISFMIENSPVLFSLPDAVVQDIRTCLHDLGTRAKVRTCFSSSDLDTKWRSPHPNAYVMTDCNEVKTTLSFADRTASRQAATETDTVRALGELYAHIANLPESSKKRKLLKQFNQASAVGTSSPVENPTKPRRSRSLTQSLKKLVGHGKKSSMSEAATVSSRTNDESVSPVSQDSVAKQSHTPIIMRCNATTSTRKMTEQPLPLARHLKLERKQPLQLLPSSIKINTENLKSGVNASAPFNSAAVPPTRPPERHKYTSCPHIRQPHDRPSVADDPKDGQARGQAPDEIDGVFVSPVRRSRVRKSLSPAGNYRKEIRTASNDNDNEEIK